MKRIWRRIVLGACWSEEQGSHPGTPLLLILTLMSAVAGMQENGWRGAAVAGGMMLAGMGSLWLWGCHAAGRQLEQWRREARERNERR